MIFRLLHTLISFHIKKLQINSIGNHGYRLCMPSQKIKEQAI